MTDLVLASVVPFVDACPAGVAATGEPAELAACGGTPLGDFADPARRGQLADRLAESVVCDWPSARLGVLIPALADLGHERISPLRIDARLYRTLQEQIDTGPCWAELADWSVTELLLLRNVGVLTARRLVAACIDHAIRVSLPDDHRWDLQRCLAELAAVLDDRRWLVLAARQVSWHDRPSRSQLAGRLGVSGSRVAQLDFEGATRLRQALDERDFEIAASTAHRLRAHLGEGPVPFSDLQIAMDAVAPSGQAPLDGAGRELLVWCAGPYDLDRGDLVLREHPGP